MILLPSRRVRANVVELGLSERAGAHCVAMVAPIRIVARMIQKMVVVVQQIIDPFLAIGGPGRVLLGIGRCIEVDKTVAAVPNAVLVDVGR